MRFWIFLKEVHGAPRVRYWGKMEVLTKVLGDGNDGTAAAILHYLQRSPDFKRRFVHECLPTECRKVSTLGSETAYYLMGLLPNNWQAQEWATEGSVREAVENGKQLMKRTRTRPKDQTKIVHVSKAAIMSVQRASDILHTGTGDQEITEEQVDELLEAVEPYIYGGAPLIQAMRYSVDLFSWPEFANHKKLLFILSDGEPKDRGNPPPPLQELSDLGVNIASCFISDHRLSDFRHLYSKADESWEPPAKFMFEISSVVKTQEIPRTLFVKKK